MKISIKITSVFAFNNKRTRLLDERVVFVFDNVTHLYFSNTNNSSLLCIIRSVFS